MLGAALLWLGTPSPSAQAALVDLTVTGVVTDVGPLIAGAFTVGQSMSATFTYDSAAPHPPSLIPTQVVYPSAVASGSFSIDGYSGSAALGRISLADDDPTLDDRFALDGLGLTGASILTQDPRRFSIQIEDSSQSAFASLDLPLTLPDVTSFTGRSWQLVFTPTPLLGSEPLAFVGGRLITVQIDVRAVPGPATWLLALAGCSLLAAGWFRRLPPRT